MNKIKLCEDCQELLDETNPYTLCDLCYEARPFLVYDQSNKGMKK